MGRGKGRGKRAQRHSDFAMDRKLGIRTTGIREWPVITTDYHRFESTPYRALDDLFEVYEPKRGAHVVDYGCGLGRVLFYFHYLYKCRGTGIELNEDTFPDLLDNRERYRLKRRKDEVPLNFLCTAAETFDPPPDSQIFFFFNPFSYRIFEKVMDRIVGSLAAHPRTADLILYYPLESYREIVRQWQAFELIEEIPLPWGTDKYDKFLIYRYTPDEGD